MTAYILDWLQLIFRSLHVITGIAWIGASFYFVWLDNHLRKPKSDDIIKKGVDGELWAVHGGGFYNPQKYLVAPQELPEDLHWFYWESYSTWMSGLALFIVLYLFNAKAMMIDPNVFPLKEWQAVALSLGFLVLGWIIYDAVCRIFQSNDKIVGIIVAIMMIGISFGTCEVFAPRAAYLITGAVMATAMTANVFFWIIPGQRKVIKSMQLGQEVDPIHGKRGKQRSVHNTYFTLPVLFAMLSNHFHLIYGHADRALMLVLMMMAALLIRHYFVLRHKSLQVWWLPALATLIIIGVAIWVAPAQTSLGSEPPRRATIADVEPIIQRRCVPCHGDHPTLMPITPKNISFSRSDAIVSHAANIYLQAVQSEVMPPGNITNITPEERLVLKSWFESQ